MKDKEIAKYAAMLAAGVVTQDALLEAIGSEDIVSQIVAASVTGVAVGVALPIIEDAVDIAADAIDAINPFNW